MTGHKFKQQCILLGLGIAILGSGHIAMTVMSIEIAKVFARPYVPITRQEAHEQIRRDCLRSFAAHYNIRSCEVSAEDISRTIAFRYTRYELDVLSPIAEKIALTANVVYGILYTVLAASFAWALALWLRRATAPAKQLVVERFRVANKMPSFITSARLSKAEKEFRTLRSLQENGLISEADFLARKQRLAVSLAKLPRTK